ncbi:S-layer homology domain-containing protein [Demequina rhizosphaerae]|uniref:S-layer homology domain-containing protein n=1 Tax=Demequina rhizosphaerae TaxID=1638985 RepID=UPI00078582F6|nr:S-layer homology domain-containing protein [Demequina rhizosphaerae]
MGNTHSWRASRAVAGTMLAALGASVLTATAAGATSDDTEAPATSAVVFDNAATAPSHPSIGFTATSTRELGDRIVLGGDERLLDSVEVGMTNWSCETGSGADCVTTPGATFDHPVTVNVYGVDAAGEPGDLLATATETVAVPFRPSADAVNCTTTPTKWYDSETGTCHNGLAFTATVPFDSTVALPDEVIVTVKYPTSRFGEIADRGPYDSLNVSLAQDAPAVGADVDGDSIVVDSSYAAMYDGDPIDVLRSTSEWSPYSPMLTVKASAVPAIESALYDFETEASFEAVSGVTPVKNGTTGITAAAGCYYAVAGQNLDDRDYEYQVTKFGGYSDAFPAGGWFTSADFYLDAAVSTGGTLNQFDWSVATNGTDGKHRRDFILHAQSAGEGSWTLGASNNAGFKAVDVAPLTGDTLTITESGWYTVRHDFSSVDGVLTVDISVADASGDVLKTWTRSNDKDTINGTVGGNRYGWIVTNGFDALPIDNVLINAERPTEGCVPTVYFTDVPLGAKAFAEITWLHEQGIASGFEDGTFRPYESVTRRNMAKFLYRLAGRPDFELPETSPFSDIEQGDGGYRAMVWLHEAEIASGYSDGTFQPNKTVTRRNMAKFLYRFADRPAFEVPATSPFSDVTTSTGGYRAMAWLDETGIATGFSDGTFRPDQDTIRRQMATFIYRFSSL